MELAPGSVSALCGLAAGVTLGVAGRAGRFCTLGMLEDAYYGSDLRRLRAFGLAAAVAVAGTQAMAAFGVIDLNRSIYLGDHFGIGGAILGGILFGVGMGLVGTCGFGTLVRIGSGDLRAIVVFLVLGVTAVATMRGLTGSRRVALIDPITLYMPDGRSQALDALLAPWLGSSARSWLTVALAGALTLWSLSSREFRRSPRLVASGLAVGSAVVFGWWATGRLAFDEFGTEPVSSLSFVAPTGDSILYVMTYSGATLNFGIGSIGGVVLGAWAAAIVGRKFRWEACDDARELQRHMIGAALMGAGGVMALGCTVGQGLSALSTLAISAPVAMASIALGARLGLEYTISGEWTPMISSILSGERDTTKS